MTRASLIPSIPNIARRASRRGPTLVHVAACAAMACCATNCGDRSRTGWLGLGGSESRQGNRRDAGRSATFVDRAAAFADASRVTLVTDDGWSIAAWVFRGSRSDGVVLVHQLTSDHFEWAPLIARLRARADDRPTIVVIDLRGHGESLIGPRAGTGVTSWTSFGTETRRWDALSRDVAAAVAHVRELLVSSGGARVALIGSSLGATAVLRFAGTGGHADLAGVAALSPGLALRGLDVTAAFDACVNAGLRVQLVASDGDASAVGAVRALAARAVGRESVSTEIYAGTGAHGVSIGGPGLHPELWDALSRWVDLALRTPAVSGASDGGAGPREAPTPALPSGHPPGPDA